MNHEILQPGPLHDENGMLTQRGFARDLILQYDRNRIRASRLRIKEWDYYWIGNDRYALAFVLADNGYMGLASVTFMDFRAKYKHTVDDFLIMPLGKLNMPARSSEGLTAYAGKKVQISIRSSKAGKSIEIHVPRFPVHSGLASVATAGPGSSGKIAEGESAQDTGNKDPGLLARIELSELPAESMVIVTPFEKRNAFYYNQKINCMKVQGGFRIGATDFDLTENSAVLDWGRGVWTYKNTWYWSSLSTKLPDGSRFGFNLGYGFGDTRAATENMLFYNGKSHKIDRVDFGIPESKGRPDFLSSWNFTSNDKRLELKFEPIFDNYTNTNLLLLSQNAHQVFGYFSGQAVLDDGKVIDLNRAFGFAEKVRNKW
ncbi:MAG: DUF2804 domain-containing protein [Leptospiraceae bacterium]|nr:DUF2804 domain-containing protein [Leptospiraceae bacterium]